MGIEPLSDNHQKALNWAIERVKRPTCELKTSSHHISDVNKTLIAQIELITSNNKVNRKLAFMRIKFIKDNERN